jgi:phosphatidylinositol-3-phosphatase
MVKLLRWALASMACMAALASPQIASAQGLRAPAGYHQIKHVFVITLENEGYDETFGPNSKAPYLAQTLPAKGALLTQYYGTGHVSLDNYIAMISGQAATVDTRNDCQTFADYQLTGMTPDGQAIGAGCVYPKTIKTLPDQLKAAGKTWRGYMGDMGNDPKRESATCGHPALNTADGTQIAEKPGATAPQGDQYATRHNPFVYFHSIIDSPDCNANVVNLSRLQNDLASAATTPNFVFITPNLCDDGHDGPCVTGQPGGLVSANQFLEKWVPIIMASPAYQRRRAADHQFRRKRLRSLGEPDRRLYHHLSGRNLLQRTAGAQSRTVSAKHRARPVYAHRERIRRGSDGGRRAVALHQARNRLRHALQSLLAAEKHRRDLRSAASRLCGAARPRQLLRLRRLGYHDDDGQSVRRLHGRPQIRPAAF